MNLNAEKVQPIVIYGWKTEVYGGCMMKCQLNGTFCSMAEHRRINVQDEESEGRSSVLTDRTKAKIEMKKQEDRHGCKNLL